MSRHRRYLRPLYHRVVVRLMRHPVCPIAISLWSLIVLSVFVWLYRRMPLNEPDEKEGQQFKPTRHADRHLYDKSRPIRRFIYHALHKTASTDTRAELWRYCRDNELTCLAYQSCQLHPIEVIRCFRNVSHANNRHIDFGTFTVQRINAGCCPRLDEVQKFDGLIDHFQLLGADNQLFLSNAFAPESFKFTIIREPSHQFASYHAMMYETRYQYRFVPNLTDTIELFYMHKRGRTELPDKYVGLYDMLTNSQSKELGWTGMDEETTHQQVISYVRSLDFVGISDHMCQTWQLLRQRLGWSNAYLRPTLPRELAKSQERVRQLNSAQRAMLQQIQHADYELYKIASGIFAKYMKY